jgi:hypothetical protein
MTLGMTTATCTLVHVVLSLTGICSGFVVSFGLLAGTRLNGWTALFLASTVATSVTGCGFPFDHQLPSHQVGSLSLVVLGVAILARMDNSHQPTRQREWRMPEFPSPGRASGSSPPMVQARGMAEGVGRHERIGRSTPDDDRYHSYAGVVLSAG